MIRKPMLFFVVMATTACVSIPKMRTPDFHQWEGRVFQLSETTLSFEVPASGRNDPKFKSIDSINIYNSTAYDTARDQAVVFSFMGWDWRMAGGIEGRMSFGAYVERFEVLDDEKSNTIVDTIDYADRFSVREGTLPADRYSPIRFKHVLRISEYSPRWLVSDFLNFNPQGTLRPESEEVFTYPLDETHFLTIWFHFRDHTYSRTKGSKAYNKWYNEAEAVADRILASVQIERTTPMPDIEYGAPDIGVVSPSEIPYIDHLSERTPLRERADRL